MFRKEDLPALEREYKGDLEKLQFIEKTLLQEFETATPDKQSKIQEVLANIIEVKNVLQSEINDE